MLAEVEIELGNMCLTTLIFYVEHRLSDCDQSKLDDCLPLSNHNECKSQLRVTCIVKLIFIDSQILTNYSLETNKFDSPAFMFLLGKIALLFKLIMTMSATYRYNTPCKLNNSTVNCS